MAALANGRFLGSLAINPTGTTAPGGNQIYTLGSLLNYQRGDKTYTVPAGYQTDLASIPQEYQQRPPHESPTARPGVLHDYLYTSQSEPRRVADRIFREALRAEGVPLGQRLAMWGAVRLFGGPAYRARLGWAPED